MPVKKSAATAATLPGAAAVPVKAAPETAPAPRRLPVKANPAPAESMAEADAAPAPVAKSGKGKTRNYQCQNGKKLRVEYLDIDTPSPTAVVRQGKKSVRMPLDEGASEGKNMIFSSDAGMLHLVKTDGNNLAKAEVLSFDHNGKPVAFACKP